MITLFLDTSLEKLVIAIVKDNSVLYEFKKSYDHEMSKYLVNEINNCFKAISMPINDIDNIVVAIGPGSFTGVRMGVTVAKTMAYALKKDLYPISSLCLMATMEETGNKAVFIDARRDHVYAAIYDKNLNLLMDEQYMALEDLMIKAKAYENIKLISDKEDMSEHNYDIIQAIKFAMKVPPVNPHGLKPNYLKITQAERELQAKNGS